MRRVWGIYLMRQAGSPVLRIGALGVIALALVSSVSIKNVIANALSTSGVTGLARFSFTALADTSLVVQLLTILALALVAWFVADTIHTTLFTRSMRTA